VSLNKYGGAEMELNILLFTLLIALLIYRMMPAKGVKQISTTELKEKLQDKNNQFVDVRTPAEYKANNIKQFKNIPLHTLKQQVNVLDREKEVVVICQSGMRSNKASKMLKKEGFTNVTNVKGGMSAWF
jgi:rhodanese-related sulfurtransferase